MHIYWFIEQQCGAVLVKKTEILHTNNIWNETSTINHCLPCSACQFMQQHCPSLRELTEVVTKFCELLQVYLVTIQLLGKLTVLTIVLTISAHRFNAYTLVQSFWLSLYMRFISDQLREIIFILYNQFVLCCFKMLRH